MKKLFLSALLGLVAGVALAAVPGQLLVSPVSVAGSFRYDGGATASGVPASGGTVTLASGAASLTGLTLTANSVISFSLKTASGTISGKPYLTAISVSAGTATVAGGGSDNSTYNYIILG